MNMLRINILVMIIVASNSAPAPYYSSLIETPTSRVQQYFFMGPRQDEPYNVQAYKTVPQFQLPKQQNVYYYQQPPQQHYYNAQQLSHLNELRQDSSYWQEFWNQITGQVSEGPSSSEQAPQEGEEPVVENASGESIEGVIIRSDAEISSTTLKSINNNEKNSFEVSSETASTTSKNQLEDLQETSHENSFEDITKNPVLDTDHEVTSTTLKPLNDNKETMKTFDAENQPELTSKLTTIKQSGKSKILDIRLSPNNNENNSLKKVKAPMHRLFYTIDDQYYVLSGSPEFYGNTDPRSLMITSLQELQPVMRNDENSNNDDAQVQKITSLPISSVEPTSTFKINVVDEDEKAEERKETDTDNNESVHINARSEPASDDQSSNENENISHDEEKQEQTAVEGESV